MANHRRRWLALMVVQLIRSPNRLNWVLYALVHIAASAVKTVIEHRECPVIHVAAKQRGDDKPRPAAALLPDRSRGSSIEKASPPPSPSCGSRRCGGWSVPAPPCGAMLVVGMLRHLVAQHALHHRFLVALPAASDRHRSKDNERRLEAIGLAPTFIASPPSALARRSPSDTRPDNHRPLSTRICGRAR